MNSEKSEYVYILLNLSLNLKQPIIFSSKNNELSSAFGNAWIASS